MSLCHSERREGAQGSVCPVGTWPQSGQSDPEQGSETMSTTEREVRMIEQPGMGPSKKASGNRAACLHSMGRASRARNMRTNTFGGVVNGDSRS